MAVRDVDRRVAHTLVVALLVAASLQVAGSVIGGIVTAFEQSPGSPDGRTHVGQVLLSFGAAGGSADVLILLAAAVVICWQSRPPQLRPAPAAVPVTRLLLGAVAVLVVLRVTGVVLLNSTFGGQGASSTAPSIAFGLGDLGLCFGGFAALHRVQLHAAVADADAAEPVLFAVDRVDAEVFAFFSRAEAVRTLSVYSIEDDEFAFYTADGHVVAPHAEGDLVEFTVTDVVARDELRAHLTAFVAKESITTDLHGPDDLESYASAVSEWQWLQLWPGWLRPVGRLVRAIGAGPRR